MFDWLLWYFFQFRLHHYLHTISSYPEIRKIESRKTRTRIRKTNKKHVFFSDLVCFVMFLFVLHVFVLMFPFCLLLIFMSFLLLIFFVFQLFCFFRFLRFCYGSCMLSRLFCVSVFLLDMLALGFLPDP